jgi:hypothetical protein
MFDFLYNLANLFLPVLISHKNVVITSQNVNNSHSIPDSLVYSFHLSFSLRIRHRMLDCRALANPRKRCVNLSAFKILIIYIFLTIMVSNSEIIIYKMYYE